MSDETAEKRAKRRAQRVLFDAVAELYDSTRRGYPEEVVDLLIETAGLRPGDPALEVGCGTGQLTVQLAQRGFSLCAIDIGRSMVALARSKVGRDVELAVAAFEDFEAPPGTYALIVSATAFHWVDPEVAWTKSARLLRPGGWIAVLATGERYDEPLGSALLEQWIRYSDDGGAFATEKKPSLAETIAASGMLEPAITHTHTEAGVLLRDQVIGLEQTRATTLSYDEPKRAAFLRDLDELLAELPEVPLTQVTSLTMARRLAE